MVKKCVYRADVRCYKGSCVSLVNGNIVACRFVPEGFFMPKKVVGVLSPLFSKHRQFERLSK